MKVKLTLITAALATLVVTGCMTTNPQTGKKEYDPVKTEQVKSVFQPLVAGTVASILNRNPEHRPIIASVQTNICLLASTNGITPAVLRTIVSGAIQQHGANLDPLAVGGIQAVLAGFDFFYASRTRADTTPELYVQHISDMLCKGMSDGLMFYPDAKKP